MSKNRMEPTPLAVLGTLDAAVQKVFQDLGVASCEQAYELLLAIERMKPGQPSASILDAAHRSRLQEELFAVLDPKTRLAIEKGTADWVQRHPLGVLPPKDHSRNGRAGHTGAGESGEED